MNIRDIKSFSVQPYLDMAKTEERSKPVTLLYLPTGTYYTFNFNDIRSSNGINVFYGASKHEIIKIRTDNWARKIDTLYMTNDFSYVAFDEDVMTPEDIAHLYKEKNIIHQEVMKKKRYRKLIFNLH